MKRIIGAIFCASFVLSHAAAAAIVSTTGSILEIVPGADVTRGSIHEANGVANLFAERTAVTLGADLLALNTAGTNSDGVIAAGTVVNSYYLYTDPLGPAEFVDTAPGTVTFSTPILGVIFRAEGLDATDAVLGLDSVTYETTTDPNVFYHGAGGFPGGDRWLIDGNTLRLEQFRTDSTNYDAIRIITAVPLPAPAVLLLSALVLGHAGLRRR